MEKALEESKKDSSDIEKIQEGFLLVDKQLKKTLTTHGLQRIEVEGQEFDPNLHQAIHKEESSEVSKEMIKEEFMPGYKLYQHLLRNPNL